MTKPHPSISINISGVLLFLFCGVAIAGVIGGDIVLEWSEIKEVGWTAFFAAIFAVATPIYHWLGIDAT